MQDAKGGPLVFDWGLGRARYTNLGLYMKDIEPRALCFSALRWRNAAGPGNEAGKLTKLQPRNNVRGSLLLVSTASCANVVFAVSRSLPSEVAAGKFTPK